MALRDLDAQHAVTKKQMKREVDNIVELLEFGIVTLKEDQVIWQSGNFAAEDSDH